ncbi:DUF2017 family protein [Granulicoccus sp. GXG6511]|uniref:DUF2017 family protein n=1 Tax=Granulicoccus sp. GXG6511 TaxID=3381351 RepID=UPI003D7EF4C3
MARYAYDGETVTLYLTNNDIELLDSLADRLIELLCEGQPETSAPAADDPFARWEAELAAPAEVDDDEVSDPAMQRLFPNPYPHDAQAASDYRRYAEGDHRRRKLDDARVVRRCLANGLPVRIVEDDVDPWLKTLNALRLVLATRLGLDDEEAVEEMHRLPDDDPRVMMGAVMDWLAYIQGIIIELREPGLGD